MSAAAVWRYIEQACASGEFRSTDRQIATVNGVHVNTVSSLVSKKVAEGCLEVERRKRCLSTYRLKLTHKVDSQVESQNGQLTHKLTHNPRARVESDLFLPGPKEERKEGRKRDIPTVSTSAEHEVVVEAWNVMARETGLSKVVAMTSERRERLSARLRQHGTDGVLEAIAEIGASRFCHGQNDRGWKASFDFLLQESSLAKAREGKYRDRIPPSRVAQDRPTTFVMDGCEDRPFAWREAAE